MPDALAWIRDLGLPGLVGVLIGAAMTRWTQVSVFGRQQAAARVDRVRQIWTPASLAMLALADGLNPFPEPMRESWVPASERRVDLDPHVEILRQTAHRLAGEEAMQVGLACDRARNLAEAAVTMLIGADVNFPPMSDLDRRRMYVGHHRDMTEQFELAEQVWASWRDEQSAPPSALRLQLSDLARWARRKVPVSRPQRTASRRADDATPGSSARDG